jgi:multidrug resistance efflux pump
MVDKPTVLRFLRWTANRAYDHKNMVRTPDFKDRLGAASAAKKAQIERARAIAEDPARLRRIEARSEIIAARNIRIAERERVRREAIAREAAERAAAEAAEAAAQAARKAKEEAREARRVEQARLDAAAAAERAEALLAIRRVTLAATICYVVITGVEKPNGPLFSGWLARPTPATGGGR